MAASRSVRFRAEIGPVPARDRSGSAPRSVRQRGQRPCRGRGRSPTTCPGPRPARARHSGAEPRGDAVGPVPVPLEPGRTPRTTTSPIRLAPVRPEPGRTRPRLPWARTRRLSRTPRRPASSTIRGTRAPPIRPGEPRSRTGRDPVRTAKARSHARSPSVEQAHPLRALPILGQPLRRNPGHDHTENRQCEPMSTRNSTDLGEGEPRGRSDRLQYPYHAMLMSCTSCLAILMPVPPPPPTHTTSASPSRTLRNMLIFT